MEINNKDKVVSLEDMYNNMLLSSQTTNNNHTEWAKVGDVYKKYSIYDSSKYETILSTSIIINK